MDPKIKDIIVDQAYKRKASGQPISMEDLNYIIQQQAIPIPQDKIVESQSGSEETMQNLQKAKSGNVESGTWNNFRRGLGGGESDEELKARAIQEAEQAVRSKQTVIPNPKAIDKEQLLREVNANKLSMDTADTMYKEPPRDQFWNSPEGLALSVREAQASGDQQRLEQAKYKQANIEKLKQEWYGKAISTKKKKKK